MENFTIKIRRVRVVLEEAHIPVRASDSQEAFLHALQQPHEDWRTVTEDLVAIADARDITPENFTSQEVRNVITD